MWTELRPLRAPGVLASKRIHATLFHTTAQATPNLPPQHRASANRLRPVRRGGEVEVQFLFGGVADECPVVDEAAAVAVAEVVEDDAAGGTEAGWHLEQVDEFLGRRERQREGFGGRCGRRPSRTPS